MKERKTIAERDTAAKAAELQWGRSDEGAEDEANEAARYLRYQLQWGRSDEGAEDDWMFSMVAVAIVLQWGRSDEGAEDADGRLAVEVAVREASMGPLR